MLLLVKDCREEMVWICLNNILLSSTMVDSFYHRNGCGGRNMEGTMQEPMSFGVVPKQLPPSLESDLSDNGSQDLQKSLAMAMARPIDWYNPIGSMYGIYGNIYHQYTPNVTIYIAYMDPMGYTIRFYLLDSFGGLLYLTDLKLQTIGSHWPSGTTLITRSFVFS